MTISASTIFRLPGLSAWWSATNPAGDNSVPANGASISPWINLFNNGVSNGTNGTGANQPTYNSNLINNYPALAFNGTTQTLGVANSATLQLSTSFCIFATVDVGLLAANQTIFSKGNNAGNPDYIVFLNRTTFGQISFWNRGLNAGVGGWIDSPTNFSKTGSEPVIIAINWTGSVYSFYANGVNLGTVVSSTSISTSTDPAVIGAQGAVTLANKFSGSIADLVICRRFAGASDFTDAYRFLAFRSGLKSI
jgi:hypothetical protein